MAGETVERIGSSAQSYRRACGRYRLPAVYPYRQYVTSGGLVSYGPDPLDQYRRVATYVDRIIKGEKPEQPARLEFVVNLKTARALGLEVQPMLLAHAAEVIE
jgi:putative tryptophan/tyrosine transport system substrate-binding protein